MGNEINTPEDQLTVLTEIFQKRQDQVALAADLLKNILKINGLEYEKIISGQEEITKIEIGIQTGTIVDLIFTLQNALIQMKRDKRMIAVLDDIEYSKRHFDDIIHENIKSAKRSAEKAKAYRWAAQWKGWSYGKRTSNFDLLDDYMELIGRKYLPLKNPTTEQKIEAIELLTKKYQIKSYNATYQQLNRERRDRVNELESKNKDATHFKNILPENNPSEGNEADDGRLERYPDCQFYDNCLAEAAHSNYSLECAQCKKYKPTIR